MPVIETDLLFKLAARLCQKERKLAEIAKDWEQFEAWGTLQHEGNQTDPHATNQIIAWARKVLVKSEIKG